VHLLPGWLLRGHHRHGNSLHELRDWNLRRFAFIELHFLRCGNILCGCGFLYELRCRNDCCDSGLGDVP